MHSRSWAEGQVSATCGVDTVDKAPRVVETPNKSAGDRMDTDSNVQSLIALVH